MSPKGCLAHEKCEMVCFQRYKPPVLYHARGRKCQITSLTVSTPAVNCLFSSLPPSVPLLETLSRSPTPSAPHCLGLCNLLFCSQE